MKKVSQAVIDASARARNIPITHGAAASAQRNVATKVDAQVSYTVMQSNEL